MSKAQLVLGVALAIGMSSSWALADGTSASGLRQPANIHQSAYYDYGYDGLVAADEPASKSPSDVPPTPEGKCGGCCDQTCDSCDSRHCHCGWQLRQPCALKCRGITIGGWLAAGISVNAANPVDNYNGVVTFNDRDGEFQMNQFWLFMERAVNTRGYGWDVGGRIDFVYGTDARFTQAVEGLEADWNQTERFYQASFPQFYVDVAYNDLTVRMGHFLSILGYENVQAPENFFYSHAYTMQYGEPKTHTGVLAIYDLADRLSISLGIHSGIDQFEDNDDGLEEAAFLGGVNWTSWNRRTTLAFGITSGEQGPDNNTVLYSFVGTFKPTNRLSYVFQHDWGQSTGGNVNGLINNEWYGINQYLFYEINPCWTAGLRIEWFNDMHGTRVRGLGDGNLNAGPYAGDFYEIALGLNWKPNHNVIIRPELRWDWFETNGREDPNPYDANNRADQFMFGIDAIVTF
jgi:hypothetical protein